MWSQRININSMFGVSTEVVQEKTLLDIEKTIYRKCNSVGVFEVYDYSSIDFEPFLSDFLYSNFSQEKLYWFDLRSYLMQYKKLKKIAGITTFVLRNSDFVLDKPVTRTKNNKTINDRRYIYVQRN